MRALGRKSFASFVIRLQVIGARVQGWIADDGSEDGSETYEGNSGDAVNGLCAADDARA
jgi:hypothetical protein